MKNLRFSRIASLALLGLASVCLAPLTHAENATSSASIHQGSKISTAAYVQSIVTTSVVLADGAAVTLRIRVTYSTTAQPEALVQGRIQSWFMDDGLGKTTTLSILKFDSSQLAQLFTNLKAMPDAKSAELVDLLVTSPPIEWFEQQARTTFARLKSGESVRVVVAPPAGYTRPLNASEMGQVYNLLSGLSMSEIWQLQDKLKGLLRNTGRSYDFLVIGLEVINCGCKP